MNAFKLNSRKRYVYILKLSTIEYYPSWQMYSINSYLEKLRFLRWINIDQCNTYILYSDINFSLIDIIKYVDIDPKLKLDECRRPTSEEKFLLKLEVFYEKIQYIKNTPKRIRWFFEDIIQTYNTIKKRNNMSRSLSNLPDMSKPIYVKPKKTIKLW